MFVCFGSFFCIFCNVYASAAEDILPFSFIQFQINDDIIDSFLWKFCHFSHITKTRAQNIFSVRSKQSRGRTTHIYLAHTHTHIINKYLKSKQSLAKNVANCEKKIVFFLFVAVLLLYNAHIIAHGSVNCIVWSSCSALQNEKEKKKYALLVKRRGK